MATTEQLQTETDPLEWSVADRCRKARIRAGITQEDLAAATGISIGTIINYEKGHTKRPSRANLRLWALSCGVPIDYLKTGERAVDLPDPGEPEPIPKRQKYMLLTSGQVVDMSPLASLAVAN